MTARATLKARSQTGLASRYIEGPKADLLPKGAANVALPLVQQARVAVLGAFSEQSASRLESKLSFSRPEWKRLLPWLDASGLSLYLLDHLGRLGLLRLLPQPVAIQLEQNLLDNRERTQGMIEESAGIQREFQRAGLRYVVSKGISLFPIAVPRPELRHQFDLDYLVSQASAPEATRILERRGYRMIARDANTWEFKRGEDPRVSKKDLYKNLAYRGVELHVEPATSGQGSRLDRAEIREIYGIRMPTLSSVDLFLGQALHVFKDVASPFCRGSHLLELYRHILTRHDDSNFWGELGSQVGDDGRQSAGLGLVVNVATLTFGVFAPDALTSWTVDRLPTDVRLWAEVYGRLSVLSMPPGTKLYLLLQEQLKRDCLLPRQHRRRGLIPSRLPGTVVRGMRGETLATRLARYRIQLRFILSRFCFHLVEGVRLAVESRRWHNLLEQKK